MRRRFHNYVTVPQAGSLCPACRKAALLDGKPFCYCPKCGWYPTCSKRQR